MDDSALGTGAKISGDVRLKHVEQGQAEGGKVKERFDLIFAADKYNTLLKEIKVVRKSHLDELKMNAKDMEHFRENKKVFDDKEKKLRREMREKDKLLEELKVKEEAMAPVISRLKEINEVERDFSGVNEARDARFSIKTIQMTN